MGFNRGRGKWPVMFVGENKRDCDVGLMVRGERLTFKDS